MKYILMPFIAIYHVVSAVMSVPGKLLQKIEDKAYQEQLTSANERIEQLRFLIQEKRRELTETNIKIDVLKHIGDNNNIDKSNRMGIFYRASFFGAGIKEMCRIWLEFDCKETPEEMASLLLEEYKNREC